MMRLPPGTPKSQDAALEQLWRQVCASRGTPAPDPAGLARFMEDLETHVREKLQSVLFLAARGREAPGELSLLSWAASCTRPALLERLVTHGLAFTGAHLFACGLRLREQGWDMQHRIAQLAGNPADVDTLRALRPAPPTTCWTCFAGPWLWLRPGAALRTCSCWSKARTAFDGHQIRQNLGCWRRCRIDPGSKPHRRQQGCRVKRLQPSDIDRLQTTLALYTW